MVNLVRLVDKGLYPLHVDLALGFGQGFLVVFYPVRDGGLVGRRSGRFLHDLNSAQYVCLVLWPKLCKCDVEGFRAVYVLDFIAKQLSDRLGHIVQAFRGCDKWIGCEWGGSGFRTGSPGEPAR